MILLDIVVRLGVTNRTIVLILSSNAAHFVSVLTRCVLSVLQVEQNYPMVIAFHGILSCGMSGEIVLLHCAIVELTIK